MDSSNQFHFLLKDQDNNLMKKGENRKCETEQKFFLRVQNVDEAKV